VKITEVTFIAKNKKCVSIKPKRYRINTENHEMALEVANRLLSKDKYFERYKSLPPITLTVHEV